MTRPGHLPDYDAPPLDEVVLGVQFGSVPTYTAIHAKDVWDLFRKDFPKCQEHPILDPQFETFGGANLQAGPEFIVGTPPVGSRLWFLSEDENHLIQFQRDRFLTNWRRRPNDETYPHFEGLAASMESSLRRLADYLATDLKHSIDINQAELAYVNIIPVENFYDARNWFSFWNSNVDVEGVNILFSEIIKSSSGKPYARFIHQLQSVFTADGRHKAYRLSLNFKGKPAGGDVNAAMEFLATARDTIVMRFTDLTTPDAHKVWKRFR